MSDETNETDKPGGSSIDDELLKVDAPSNEGEGEMKLTINIPFYEATECVAESTTCALSPRLISNVEEVKPVDQVEALKTTILVSSLADPTPAPSPPPAPPPPPPPGFF